MVDKISALSRFVSHSPFSHPTTGTSQHISSRSLFIKLMNITVKMIRGGPLTSQHLTCLAAFMADLGNEEHWSRTVIQLYCIVHIHKSIYVVKYSVLYRGKKAKKITLNNKELQQCFRS